MRVAVPPQVGNLRTKANKLVHIADVEVAAVEDPSLRACVKLMS